MEKCMEAAVKFLSYRSRTENEVIMHLQNKGFADEVISRVISRLKEYRYVDDEAYLKSFLASNEAVKKYGRKRVFFDLQKKGLAEEILNKLEAYYTVKTEQKLCENLSQKYRPLIKGKSVRERQKKLYEKLLRMGYNHQLVMDTVSHLDWEETDDDLQFRLEKLEKDYQKVSEKLRKKGFEGYELKQRLINNLAMRGYDYESIQLFLDIDQ